MDRPLLLVDIDGVCRNLVPALVRIYQETFQERPVLPIRIWTMRDSFPRLENPVEFFFKNKENARYVFRESPMIENCMETLYRIDQDFEIKFATAQYDGNEDHTLYWLKKHGLEKYPVEFVWEKFKLDGSALLDDSTKNLQEFEMTGRPAICFAQSWNLDWKGLRVLTWWHLELLLYYFPTLKFWNEKRVPKKVHKGFFKEFV